MSYRNNSSDWDFATCIMAGLVISCMWAVLLIVPSWGIKERRACDPETIVTKHNSNKLEVIFKESTGNNLKMFLNLGVLIVELPNSWSRVDSYVKIEDKEIQFQERLITITDENTGSVEYTKTLEKAISTDCLNKFRDEAYHAIDRISFEVLSIKMPRKQYVELYVKS